MPHQPRDLYPWEARTGCSTCKAKPGARCVTTRPLHMPPWRPSELAYVGTPTTAHKARYQLWCYLWGRDTLHPRRRTHDHPMSAPISYQPPMPGTVHPMTSRGANTGSNGPSKPVGNDPFTVNRWNLP